MMDDGSAVGAALWSVFALGLATMWRRPVAGLFILVSVIAPLGSVLWHLGAPNAPTTLVFCLGQAAGWVGWKWRHRAAPRAPGEPAIPCCVRWSAAVFLGAAALSACVAVARFSLQAPDLVAVSFARLSSSQWLASSGMAVSPVQFLLVPVVGAFTFRVMHEIGRRHLSRRRLQTAFLAGAWLTVASPWIKSALSMARVARPDKDLNRGSGWVAFFQDPHALAAYLVLVIGVSVGLALGAGRRGALSRLALGALAVQACGLLALTGSKSGLVGGIVAAWTTAVILSVRNTATAPVRRRLAIVLVAGIPTLGILASTDAVREVAADHLDRLGATGVAATLAFPDGPDAQRSWAARRVQLTRALDAVMRYPIAGAGPGGLARHQTALTDSSLREVPSAWLSENAHNYLLQVAAEFGVVAAVAFAILYGSLLVSALRTLVRERSTEGPDGWASGAVGSMIGFCVPLLAAHPLLIPELQVGVAAVAALTLSRRSPAGRTAARAPSWIRARPWLPALVGIYVVAGAWELRSTLTAAPDAPWSWGVHGWEDTRVKPTTRLERYRWTTAAARVGLVPGGPYLHVPLYSERPQMPRGGIRVRVRVGDRIVDRLAIAETPFRETLIYDLKALGWPGSDNADAELRVGFDVRGSFRPSATEATNDSRELGIQLGPIRASEHVPRGGSGFYRWERDPVSNRRFRWTRQIASLPVELSPRPVHFEVRASHPGISSDNRVGVAIFLDGNQITALDLQGSTWHRVQVPPATPARVGILTVVVSRVWNPRDAGVSRDGRYLGVAMTDIR